MEQEKRENFYRYSTLIVDHTNESFTGLLDHDLKIQNLSLLQFIELKAHEIYHLCYNREPCCMCPPGRKLPVFRHNNRILHPAQLDIMLDTAVKLPGHNPNIRTKHCCCPANPNINYHQLDLTLTRCLLLNFTNAIPYGSPERKAVDELIKFRNESYSHATKGRISNQKYQIYKAQIERCIMVLASVQGREAEFRQKLTDAPVRPLDETIIKQYQTILITEHNRVHKLDKISPTVENFASAEENMSSSSFDHTFTIGIKTMQILKEVSESVGYIHGQKTSGTCWRAGEDKIITAAHIVKGNIWNAIKNYDDENELNNIYVNFGYVEHFEERRTIFKVEPRVIHMDEVLDVAVLQLKKDKQHEFTPALQMFHRLDPKTELDREIFLIGHNKGEVKQISGKIGVWAPTEKKMADLEKFCKEYGQYNGYLELDRSDRIVIKCNFAHGAAGSPGIILLDGTPYVVLIYLRGFPDFYYASNFPQTKKNTFPQDKLFQQGACIGSFFDKLASNLPLRNEIFRETEYKTSKRHKHAMAKNPNVQRGAMGGTDYPQVQEIPSAIQQLSVNDKQLYIKIIESGTEIRHYLRVVIIGENGVGKTCLLRRLLGQSITGVKSTDGIDIHRCKINLSNGDWIFDEVSDKKKELLLRIKRAVALQDDENSYDSMRGSPGTSHNSLRRKQMTTQTTEESKFINNKVGIQPSTIIPHLTDDNEVGKESQSQLQQTSSISKLMTEKALNDFLNDIGKIDIPAEEFVECRFLDFAGEKDYYATHPVFLNSNALHLLVTNIMQDVKPIKAENGFDHIGGYLDFWLDSIHSRAVIEETKEETKTELLYPPAIIVCTRIDECRDHLKERKDIFHEQLISVLKNETKKNHLRGDILYVSNTESDEKHFRVLRDAIFKYGQQVKTFKEKLPLRWIYLEQLLDVLREAELNIISWLDIVELSSNCLIDSEDEIKLFLKYQHNVGSVIYFENIKEYIILNQKWLANAFRCLVSDKIEFSLQLSDEFIALKNTGELKHSLIEKLFNKEPDLDFNKHSNHLLNLMEIFGIIIKPTNLTEKGKKQTLPAYYMPSMIYKKASFTDIIEKFKAKKHDCKRTPWLCVEFDFMSFDFFNHILCYYISKYPLCREPETDRLAIYHGMAVFFYKTDQCTQFVLCFCKNTIAIQIWQWSNMKKEICKEMLKELENIIHTVKEKFESRRVSHTVKAKCPDGNIDKPGSRKSQCEVKNTDKYFCQEHFATHSTQDFFQTWFEEYSEGDSHPNRGEADHAMPNAAEDRHLSSRVDSRKRRPQEKKEENEQAIKRFKGEMSKKTPSGSKNMKTKKGDMSKKTPSGSKNMKTKKGIPKEAKARHDKLTTDLSDWIDPSSTLFKKLKHRLQAHLSPSDLSKANDIMDIVGSMEKKGIVVPGQYALLKTILMDLDQRIVRDLIEPAEQEICQIIDNSNIPESCTGSDNE